MYTRRLSRQYVDDGVLIFFRGSTDSFESRNRNRRVFLSRRRREELPFLTPDVAARRVAVPASAQALWRRRMQQNLMEDRAPASSRSAVNRA